MTEDKKITDFQDVFYKNFVSESKEPAIAYIENFLKRKFYTAKKADIKRALLSAAEKGAENHLVPNLLYVKDIMNHPKIMLKFSKDERIEIFVRASKADRRKNGIDAEDEELR